MSLSLEIPDDLATLLEQAAAAENKSVQALAIERLQASIAKPGSPAAIRRVLESVPGADREIVEELRKIIKESRSSSDKRLFPSFE